MVTQNKFYVFGQKLAVEYTDKCKHLTTEERKKGWVMFLHVGVSNFGLSNGAEVLEFEQGLIIDGFFDKFYELNPKDLLEEFSAFDESKTSAV